MSKHFIFAHGAGADKDSDWMSDMSVRIKHLGICVHQFNFPYMVKRVEDGKRRPPDRLEKLIESFKQQIENLQSSLSANDKLYIGGKSMGGRIASIIANETQYCQNNQIYGVICLGFPFHPPNKLDKYKGVHLDTIKIPALILQGERDTMGNAEEIEGYSLSKAVTVSILPDGDHSFKPRIRSGHSFEKNLNLAVEQIDTFLGRTF